MLRSSMTKMLLIGIMMLLSAGTSLAQTTAETQTPKSVPTSAPYLLAGDDVLSINVVNLPNFAPEVTHVIVPPDGKIAMPPLEPFSILGKTTTAVAQMLAEKWKKYGINRSVSVSVVQKRRERVRPFMAWGDNLLIPEIRNWIFVMGAVAHPGFYFFKPGDRLLDALDAMGGPIRYANLKKVSLLHIAKDKQSAQATEINFENFLKKGGVTSNVPLMAGDVLFVPEKTHTTPYWSIWSSKSVVESPSEMFTGHFGD